MNEKSGHWTNTGMAKFINDNLYNYDLNDEKSMNPFKWNHVQNGGDINDFREAINGFPCRLILVNDGETPLNTGQNEPTPGNTKDMGIFNFNNDKDNVTTLGFDSDIFPNCASYEVTANSDTSAGAFMSYNSDAIGYAVPVIDRGTYYHTVPIKVSDINPRINTNDFVITINFTNDVSYHTDIQLKDHTITLIEPGKEANTNRQYMCLQIPKDKTSISISNRIFKVGEIKKPEDLQYCASLEDLIDSSAELNYIKQSFELRYPDADDVSEDWGFMGVGEEGTGLKALIDWVDNCTDEEFVADFEEHFHKDYTLRYFCLVTLIGAVDNLGGHTCRV